MNELYNKLLEYSVSIFYLSLAPFIFGNHVWSSSNKIGSLLGHTIQQPIDALTPTKKRLPQAIEPVTQGQTVNNFQNKCLFVYFPSHNSNSSPSQNTHNVNKKSQVLKYYLVPWQTTNNYTSY